MAVLDHWEFPRYRTLLKCRQIFEYCIFYLHHSLRFSLCQCQFSHVKNCPELQDQWAGREAESILQCLAKQSNLTLRKVLLDINGEPKSRAVGRAEEHLIYDFPGTDSLFWRRPYCSAMAYTKSQKSSRKWLPDRPELNIFFWQMTSVNNNGIDRFTSRSLQSQQTAQCMWSLSKREFESSQRQPSAVVQCCKSLSELWTE